MEIKLNKPIKLYTIKYLPWNESVAVSNNTLFRSGKLSSHCTIDVKGILESIDASTTVSFGFVFN